MCCAEISTFYTSLHLLNFSFDSINNKQSMYTRTNVMFLEIPKNKLLSFVTYDLLSFSSVCQN